MFLKSLKMSFGQSEEREPLVSSSDSSTKSYQSIQHLSHAEGVDEEAPGQDPHHSTIEDDVLPERATTGRTLSWSSAYILIMSRVIGSGIFATPGAIVTSVGSVGLTLTLWVVGAFVAWCGLSVALEYGCMLPRSGGKLDVEGVARIETKREQGTKYGLSSPTGIQDSSPRRW